MFEIFYFILGVVNNLLLILIFILARTSREDFLKRVGIAYLTLALPSLIGLGASLVMAKPVQYPIFLGIFIAFLLLEGLYEYVLKLPFRRNWKLLTPYLVLYWAMNYGFLVMAWQHSKIQGRIILSLFVIQIVTNIGSHTKKSEG